MGCLTLTLELRGSVKWVYAAGDDWQVHAGLPCPCWCRYKPRSHTIIEAHPDVYKHMCEQGWDKKENVRMRPTLFLRSGYP
jgi:hypothetical protein